MPHRAVVVDNTTGLKIERSEMEAMVANDPERYTIASIATPPRKHLPDAIPRRKRLGPVA